MCQDAKTKTFDAVFYEEFSMVSLLETLYSKFALENLQ